MSDCLPEARCRNCDPPKETPMTTETDPKVTVRKAITVETEDYEDIAISLNNDCVTLSAVDGEIEVPLYAIPAFLAAIREVTGVGGE